MRSERDDGVKHVNCGGYMEHQTMNYSAGQHHHAGA